ncbi:MAG: PAS domain-containing sensor histidine kinase [Cyanobacteria bacterium P01_A01_bin.84]
MDLQELQVFEQWFSNVDIAFWVCSPDVTEYYYVSSGYEKIWGRTIASLKENPHSFLDAVHPDDIKRITETAIGVEPWNMDAEYRIIRPDGTVRWVRDRTYPIYDEQGNIYRMAGIAEDITESKITQRELFESEEKFQQFANNAEVVFWICEPDVSKFHYISPGYEKIWGRKCAQVYENPRSFLESVHPEDLERVIEAAVGEKACFMDEQYRIILSDGTIKWVRDKTYPIYDEQGNIYRMAGIAEDITQIKQAEAETIKVLQRERELSDAKTDFIATTSHEIRTPLSVIQSSLDILQHTKTISEERKEIHFQKIESAIGNITSIVQNVLLIAEDAAGSLQFQPIEVDIVKLSQEVMATFNRDDEKQSPIEFKVSGDSNSLAILDPRLINHILTNLLENALKYSPAHSKVQLKLELSPNQITFHVQDKGIGIPAENIPHIFDSFYRGNNVNAESGTGLGLPIVKRCVESHNGKITLNSVVYEGTTFSVILPR